MLKITSHRQFSVPSIGTIVPVAIDQYPAQDFNRGANGLPANDLTLLERAQTLAEAQLVASRLQELKLNVDMSDLSDREIVARIRPSWVQTPAEIDRFMDYYYANVVEPGLGKRSDGADSKSVVTDGVPDVAPDTAPAAE